LGAEAIGVEAEAVDEIAASTSLPKGHKERLELIPSKQFDTNEGTKCMHYF